MTGDRKHQQVDGVSGALSALSLAFQAASLPLVLSDSCIMLKPLSHTSSSSSVINLLDIFLSIVSDTNHDCFSSST